MKKFIIVGTQRTGSSVIAESLGLHPMITCGWEWTLKIPRAKKLLIAEKAQSGNFKMLHSDDQEHLKKVHNEYKSCIGFRWLFSSSAKWIIHPRFSPALWLDRLEDFIFWASQTPDIHIIHVVRFNSLEWLKSVYLSRKANLYTKKEYPEGIKVKIPKLEAIYRLRAKNWVDSRLNSLSETNPYHYILYENFMTNKEVIIENCITFLGFDPKIHSTKKPTLKKQSKGKVSDYIINYEELLKILSRLDLLYSKVSSGK